MEPLRKLVLVTFALVAGLVALGGPARSQDDNSARFVFADTTLLRDTLNLKFDRLFPVADSLRMKPDTLRALSIRYRIPIPRLVHLSDSLRVPVDSVGVVVERERYNPLSAPVQTSSIFAYNSGYNIDRRSTTWTNDTSYDFSFRSLFVRSVTSIQITRIRESGVSDLHKSRTLNAEVGWRFSRALSVGGRMNLQGTENFKPGSIYNNSQTTNQYDFSVRTRRQPTPNFTVEANLFGGPFDEPESVPIKRGMGAVLSSRISYRKPGWFDQDLSATVNSRFGRARLQERPWLDTRDLTTDVRGSMSALQNGPVRVLLTYNYKRSEFQRPDTLNTTVDSLSITRDVVRRQPSWNRGADLSIRLESGQSRYLNLTGGLSRGQTILAVTRDGVFTQDRGTSEDLRFGLDGRFDVRGWSLEGRFNNGLPISEQPRRSIVGGQSVYYRERQKIHSRSVEVQALRNLTRRISMNATGSVSLNSTFLTASGVNHHTLDDYRQSYRVESQITLSQKASTRLRLEVSRTLYISLLAVSSASNREDRTYRADWHWTYRLLSGLTVNQLNQLSAGYTYYSFVTDNNRLTLDYANITTLNAVLTPRLTIALTHNARNQPSGGYTRGEDGNDYFRPADEGRDYNLSGSITYQPVSGLSLRLSPTYSASDRSGTVEGQETPVSRRRSLNFSGGASLDLPVSSKGRLSGNISRAFASARSTRYQNGVPQDEPRFSDDYWNGSLQFSWTP